MNSPFSFGGNLLPYSHSPNSLILIHPHLVLAITSSTCTHPVTKICQFPCCFHFITTVFPAPLPPIFPSHFLHVQFLEYFVVTLFILAHLPWIHLPHCTHKTELAFTLKLPTPHRSTFTFRHAILCDAATDHCLGFWKVNFEIHALKNLLPF